MSYQPYQPPSANNGDVVTAGFVPHWFREELANTGEVSKARKIDYNFLFDKSSQIIFNWNLIEIYLDLAFFEIAKNLSYSNDLKFLFVCKIFIYSLGSRFDSKSLYYNITSPRISYSTLSFEPRCHYRRSKQHHRK